MKPLTISDFSFAIKQPTQKVSVEPVKRPEAKDVQSSEVPIDTDKLTDEQVEKFNLPFISFLNIYLHRILYI